LRFSIFGKLRRESGSFQLPLFRTLGLGRTRLVELDWYLRLLAGRAQGLSFEDCYSMKLRFLVPAVALALTTMAAQAQIGLYLNPVVSRISNSKADTGPFAFLGDGQTSQIFGGVDFGGYYEFAHFAKSDVSLDVRDAIQHGNNALINSFMVGLRLSAKPMTFGLKPYGQFSVGAGRTRSPFSPDHIDKLQYGVYVGVDKPIKKHVDWRIVEVSYGSVTTVSSAIFDSDTTPIPAATVLGFSTGFVFRIP
jgi:hypothetical protein